jgi:uncharacterized protein (DUF302 family)
MEEKIGILLPCNVIVLETEEGKIEVAIMDPAVAMSVVENTKLESLASVVREKLELALSKI